MKRMLLALLVPTVIIAQKQPKLIVGIVADQMRYEMLDRYRSDFGPGGFNLLVDQGMGYDSCTFSYIPTFTAPGHATIYTGVVPSEHAILANDIYIPEAGKDRYCVVDEDATPLGTTEENCKRSPLNLRAYTIGDSLKIADEKSKVIAVSIKDRGAILPGGKKADAAYWMDDNGMMVSSDYYMDELPLWVDSFNMAGYVFNNVLASWDYIQDSDEYDESLPDDSPYEKHQFGDAHVLPYNISQAIRTKGLGVLRETPFANSLLAEFAIWAIQEEGLGSDKHTDLLAISFSSTDYIGHAYGPQSVEVQDAYLRLDRDLANLIHVLDTEIGRENYVLFLTADHGAANTPADANFKYVKKSDLKDQLNGFTKSQFGIEAVKHIASQQIWFDKALIRLQNIDSVRLRESLIDFMKDEQRLGFTTVFTKEGIQQCQSGDCLPFRNAFISALSGDLFYIRKYGEIERSNGYGTTHGTGYLYDTHVPLLFFGGNVEQGSSKTPVSVSDIRRLLKTYLPGW